MDIRNYITFNTVVETEGFTKAAHRLSYAQSTVTLHIKELEKYYDTLLFDRIGRKIYLTSFGKRLYEQTKRLERRYNEVIALDKNAEHSEVIRIGVFESLLKYRIKDMIHEFKTKYPQVDMVMLHGTCKELRKQVRDGELDMTFQFEPIREFRDLTTQVLCEEECKLILPKGKTKDIMYHKNQIVYLTEQDCSYRLMFEEYLNQNDIIKYNSMETGSVDLIKQYVALGQGFSLVPKIAVSTKQDEDQLEILTVDYGKKIYTQVMHHKDKVMTDSMKAFMKMLKEYAKEWNK